MAQCLACCLALVPVSSVVQRTGAAGVLGKGRSPWGSSVEGAVTLPVAFGWKEMPPDPRFLFSSVFFLIWLCF